MIQTNDIPIVPVPDIVPSEEKAWESLKGLSFDDAITKIANSMVDFAFKLLIAIVVFYVGRFIIRRIFKFVRNLMINRRMDASLITFVLSFVKMVLYFILIVTIIGILGIETSSFLALFASAGVAIGMALSGTLQNFAGGVLLLILKPYKVGDFIEVSGYTGKVKEIQIFHTILNTVDNKAIIIPNGGLSTGSINNYSLESYRRVEWIVGLCYGMDFAKARETIMEMLISDDRVVKTTIKADKEMRKKLDKIRNLPDDEENRKTGDGKEGYEDAKNKTGWWQRMKMRRKKHQEMVQERLNAKVSLTTGIPMDELPSAPFIGIDRLADSSVNIVVRAWTPAKLYWDLYFDMNARFYTELPAKGFDFPFPQMDVHLSHTDS